MMFIFCMQTNIEYCHWTSMTMHAQSTSNTAWGMKLSFCLQINTKFFYKMVISLFFCFCFSIRVFFHGHWQLTGQQGKGEDHFLFHSTTSTRSRTLGVISQIGPKYQKQSVYYIFAISQGKHEV